MRKLAVLSLLLVLTACGGGSSVAACDVQYWDGAIGTCLPSGWRTVERSVLDERGVPGEVVAAFQTTNPLAGQYPTVTVTRETLGQPMSSPDYSRSSVESVKGLNGYALIDSKEVAIDGEGVEIHTFTAQPRAEQPASRFYQLSFSREQTGYTFTASTPLSVDEALENQIMLILENATAIAPTTEE